jgi:hypothetical protein
MLKQFMLRLLPLLLPLLLLLLASPFCAQAHVVRAPLSNCQHTRHPSAGPR